jgi:hypothetical protein
MQTAKQIVHEIAEQLPPHATLEDAMHTLYVRQKLERSIASAEGGDVISQDEMGKHYLHHES